MTSPILNFTYPLTSFMIWLTGNNREVEIDIPDELAAAIVAADPEEQIAHVDTLWNGRKVVYWAEFWRERQLYGMDKMELLDRLTQAIQSNDTESIKVIQRLLT